MGTRGRETWYLCRSRVGGMQAASDVSLGASQEGPACHQSFKQNCKVLDSLLEPRVQLPGQR